MRESTYLGFLFTCIFVTAAVALFYNQLSLYRFPTVTSELIVDHLKDDKEILVHLDVDMTSYPCAFLSLDKLDAVHTHTLNVKEGLFKYRIISGRVSQEPFEHLDTQTDAEKYASIEEQFSAGEGCKVRGSFSIKLVPGNFHISFHAYPQFVRNLISKGHTFDFSHKINHLSFGEFNAETVYQLKRDFSELAVESCNDLDVSGMISYGYPHIVTHHLNIVPSRFQYENSGKIIELFQYTSTHIKSTGSPQVMFKFSLENVIMIYKFKESSLVHFLLMLMAIFGGLYMIIDFVRAFLEDALLKLIFKRRIGKLE